MQAGKISWLLNVILVLALAAASPAAAGGGPKTDAGKDQGDPAEIQIIRRIAVTGVSPAERSGPRGPREAGKAKTGLNSTPATRVSSSAVRSTPVRSASTGATAVRSTTVPPVRIAPGRA
jgi:hypothetical protein